MEKLFHARWWDYSSRKFNINGRVCLIGAFAFGSLSLILIKLVHPLTLKFIGMMSDAVFHITVISLAIIFITDNVITIAGFCHFDKKLHKISEELKQYRDKLAENIKAKTTNLQLSNSIAEIQENLAKKFNFQEKRMLKAFPKFKSINPSVNHNEILEKLKEKLSINKK